MNDNPCCDEYEAASELSRRRFMATMAAGAGVGVAATTFGGVFRQASFGAQRDNNVVVVISLRGGIDGLSVVVPYKEHNYYTSRPGIAIPEGSLICKNDTFGLHPALQPMERFWTENRFAAVQAVGLKVPDRSHFSAMEAVEDADPGFVSAPGLDQPGDRSRQRRSARPRQSSSAPRSSRPHWRGVLQPSRRRTSADSRWLPPIRSGTARSGVGGVVLSSTRSGTMPAVRWAEPLDQLSTPFSRWLRMPGRTTSPRPE